MPFMSAEHRAALERMMTSKFSQDEEDSLEPAFGELESAFSSQMNREQQTRFVNQKTQDSGDDDGSVSSSIDEEKEETYLNLGCSGQPAKEMLQPTGETEFRRLRLLFVLCLLVIGLIVSVATFLTLREQETLNSIRSVRLAAIESSFVSSPLQTIDFPLKTFSQLTRLFSSVPDDCSKRQGSPSLSRNINGSSSGGPE